MGQKIHSRAVFLRCGAALGFAALISLTQTGCAYLHNEGRAKQADSALTTYRNFQTNSGGVFGLMLENHAKVQQALAERQAAAAELKFKAYASSVPALKWKDLSAEIESILNKYDDRTNALGVSFARAVTNQLELKVKLKSAKEALDEIQKRRAAAEKEKIEWMAREELFKGFIEFYAGNSSAISKLDKELLAKAKNEILKRKVGEKEVGDLLSDEFKELGEFKLEAAKPYTVEFLDPTKAPGIKVQLLSLGEDLARARVKRFQLDAAWLDSLKETWENQLEALDKQKEHLEKAKAKIVAINQAEFIVTDTVAAFQQKTNNEKASGLQISSEGMLFYILATTYDESLVRELETKPAALGHERSLRLAQINAQEREALILRGVQGLNRYHNGGLTSEEIANLIRAAQSAGIGVIGARVGD